MNNNCGCEKIKKSHLNRIVSVYQKYVSPIVRGKTRYNTEFGVKINLSEVNPFFSFFTIKNKCEKKQIKSLSNIYKLKQHKIVNFERNKLSNI